MSRTITIVAKGPTAAHAQQWIDKCPGSDVAIINESGLVLRKNQPIRFAFFCHAVFVEKMRPLWGRVDCFVSPVKLLGRQKLPADFPTHKRIRYGGNVSAPYHTCPGGKESLRVRLKSGAVVHHHTVTAAMSWLAKIGYKRIRIIGVGGQGYAPGLKGAPKLPKDSELWPRVERTLAGLLRELYGVKTEYYHASNHPCKSK